MAIPLSASERDAIYQEVLISLSGIDDVWSSVRSRDFKRADRVGREHSDNLRLLLDDLGWVENAVEGVQLTTPDDVLERVFSRIRRTADARLSTEQESREEQAHNRLVVEICATVLNRLHGRGPI